jgi:hypothetical protein
MLSAFVSMGLIFIPLCTMGAVLSVPFIGDDEITVRDASGIGVVVGIILSLIFTLYLS